MKNLKILLPSIGLILFASLSQARPVVSLPPKQLTDISDTIVIANPSASTIDTNEKVDVLSLMHLNGKIDYFPFKSVGVETYFRVAVVFKGDKSIKQLTLHHYRPLDLKELYSVETGPICVSFSGPTAITRKSKSYLLFLSREPDGRYAPAGGQMDAGERAVHELQGF